MPNIQEKFEEKAIEGAILNVADLKREDGILTVNRQQAMSFVHRMISALGKNDDYRQELKTALFKSPDEADMCVSALEECRELGMDPTPIIDQMIARSAGENHGLLRLAVEAISHSSFSVNQQKGSAYRKQPGSSPLGDSK